MALSLKKWLASHTFSKFMDDTNDNWTTLEGAVIYESGTNYIRFGDGTQVCWLFATATYASTSFLQYVWTLPKAFTNNSYIVALYHGLATGNKNFGSVQSYASVKNTGNMTINVGHNGTSWGASDTIPINVIVVGKWK